MSPRKPQLPVNFCAGRWVGEARDAGTGGTLALCRHTVNVSAGGPIRRNRWLASLLRPEGTDVHFGAACYYLSTQPSD